MNKSENGYVSIQKPLSGDPSLLKVLFSGNQIVAGRAVTNLLSAVSETSGSETSGFTFIPDDSNVNSTRSVWAVSQNGFEVEGFTEEIIFEAHKAYMDAMEFIHSNPGNLEESY